MQIPGVAVTEAPRPGTSRSRAEREPSPSLGESREGQGQAGQFTRRRRPLLPPLLRPTCRTHLSRLFIGLGRRGLRQH